MRYLRNIACAVLILVISPIFSAAHRTSDKVEKPFVILIASYNNERYARENIISALDQHYSNYRIVFINDCSSDRTLDVVKKAISDCNAEDKVIIIDNKTRKLGLRNYYEAIVNYTKDEEIIVNLDGDDFLANKNVLSVLNKVYGQEQKEIWLTYGQFVGWKSKSIGWNVKIPKKVIEENNFRNFPQMPTHLRTFYSWLFKKINKNDLLYQDHFFEVTWDCAFMFPMLEMCGGRFAFIDKVLYVYNDNNPINDYKTNPELQHFYFLYIRSLPKYKQLRHTIFSQCHREDCSLCNESIKDEIYEKT